MPCTNSRSGMDRILLIISMFLPRLFGLTITASRYPSGTLVIGNNLFTLACVIDSQGDDVLGTELSRKRAIDNDYETIVSFAGPATSRNASYLDTSLESRTIAVSPTLSSMIASLTFKDTVCADKASYRCTVNYYDTRQRSVTAITEIKSLKALSTFKDDGQVSFLPKSNLQEGVEVVFSCQGNVGNLPIGELVWYVYTYGKTSGGSMQSQNVTTNPPTVETGNHCSYRRLSSLRLTMTRDLDGAVVRCTAQQDVKNEFGDNNDNYKQTGTLSVMYSPRNLIITVHPAGRNGIFDEGTELVTLTCYAFSNPKPNYYWIASANSSTPTIAGAVLQLRSLTWKDTGEYTCVVQNTIDGQSYSATVSASITVDRDLCALETSACDQNCQKTLGGYSCSCRNGYTLNDDGVTCDDVDECMLGTAGCPQDCWNTAGSFKCSCHEGFIGYDDDRTCEAAPPATDGTSTAALTGVAVVGWTVAVLLAAGIGLVVWRRRRRDSLFLGMNRGKKTVAESREPHQPGEAHVVTEGTQSYDLVQTQADSGPKYAYENSGLAPYESLQMREEGPTYEELQRSGHPDTGYQNL